MANVPYPLTASDLDELKGQVYELMRQLYEDKIGGADLGDVFSLPGDVLTLAIADSSGLTKSGNTLAVEPSSTGGLQVTVNGLGIQIDGATLTLSASGLKVTTPISGDSGTVTVLTQIQAGGAGPKGFQYKNRDLTVATGLITSIGVESGWNDV
jgi:hypothetical protein